jgi:predicted tellurium resistance membrane protein TerC
MQPVLMELVRDPQAWIGLLTLTALELVLGVDNIIFIAILAGKLKGEEQKRARDVGLTLALGTRILLLLSIAWIARLTRSRAIHWRSVFDRQGGHGIARQA